ncbi:NgoFVII family restriction endonuclease [Halobacillus andaensis]|uniref:NgoFVII family restriction endonuclease n=1 Tax=Halobacillus andaensis TaxID=1176239 RepID=A0A917B2Z2_HALAA|nr:restriction endonuclease PLD domain-containing protein [Halobacillus andaensis]MBP2004914.1 hypothetical protein [Halobacillus andaensis]GGF17912.1 NgoFVII family restriction endonuclease [Halobacillus andaensis]
MPVISSNFLRHIVEKPLNEGRTTLKVLTGYSSPSYILNLLKSFDSLHLEVIIGMAHHNSIPIWDHNQYNELLEKYRERLSIKYYYGEPPIHSKIYYWKGDITLQDVAFIGSPNLTRNGFSKNKEVVKLVEANEVEYLFNEVNVISCDDERVSDYINFSYEQGARGINTSAVGRLVQNEPFVELMLTEANKPRQVHTKSGLNWGHREGRDRNQAYIPVPLSTHQNNLGFFPERGERFTIITDDGESFACVMAQANSKAIQSSYDNSILGRYFRRRLGLQDGEFITIDHLDQYGRNFVTLYKINDESYFLDFS